MPQLPWNLSPWNSLHRTSQGWFQLRCSGCSLVKRKHQDYEMLPFPKILAEKCYQATVAAVATGIHHKSPSLQIGEAIQKIGRQRNVLGRLPAMLHEAQMCSFITNYRVRNVLQKTNESRCSYESKIQQLPVKKRKSRPCSKVKLFQAGHGSW